MTAAVLQEPSSPRLLAELRPQRLRRQPAVDARERAAVRLGEFGELNPVDGLAGQQPPAARGGRARHRAPVRWTLVGRVRAVEPTEAPAAA